MKTAVQAVHSVSHTVSCVLTASLRCIALSVSLALLQRGQLGGWQRANTHSVAAHLSISFSRDEANTGALPLDDCISADSCAMQQR